MRKKLKILAVFFSVLTAFCFFGTVEARAEDGTGVIADETTGTVTFDYDDVSGLEKTVLRMLDMVTTPSETVTTWMKVGVMDTGGGKQETEEKAIEIMNNIFKYFQTFGMCLLVIYFLMDYSKTTLMQGADFTMKSMAVSFLKLGLGWLLLYFAPAIVSGIFDTNNGIVDEVIKKINGEGLDTVSFEATKNAKIKMVEQVREMGILDCIGAIPNLLIAELGAVLGNCIILYQAISRKLEIYIRTAFVPLAMGDCYEGVHSTGARYIKKFFAICLWGVGMLLIVAIESSLCGSYIMGIFSSDFNITDLSVLIKVILFPLAAGGMCSGVKQICCDALGC